MLVLVLLERGGLLDHYGTRQEQTETLLALALQLDYVRDDR